jgi:hypothetical protein
MYGTGGPSVGGDVFMLEDDDCSSMFVLCSKGPRSRTESFQAMATCLLLGLFNIRFWRRQSVTPERISPNSESTKTAASDEYQRNDDPETSRLITT